MQGASGSTSRASVSKSIGNTGSNQAFHVVAQVSPDGLAFFLTEHKGDCPVGGLVHLYVPDVDGWFDEFQQRGVPIQEPPNECLQGLRSMTASIRTETSYTSAPDCLSGIEKTRR